MCTDSPYSASTAPSPVITHLHDFRATVSQKVILVKKQKHLYHRVGRGCIRHSFAGMRHPSTASGSLDGTLRPVDQSAATLLSACSLLYRISMDIQYQSIMVSPGRFASAPFASRKGFSSTFADGRLVKQLSSNLRVSNSTN